MAPKLSFKNYSIAWIAPLEIELMAALSILDKEHDGNFPTDQGDDYQYFGGEINNHNILIASFPPGTQYGGVTAAALAAQVRKCLKGNFWFGLLVGIAAGLPDPSHDIRLGDVLVSLPESEKPGVIQYDMGKQHPNEYENRSQQTMTSTIVRATIGKMKIRARRRGNKYDFMEYLQTGDLKDEVDERGEGLFRYPGQKNDHLYESVQNAEDKLVQREPRPDASRTQVWYGNIGSGNTLMKSSQERDALRDKYQIIGLEMEAHGVMNTMPVGHIRGTCDYADKHMLKNWQGYAAVVAAAYARKILCSIDPADNNHVEKPKRFDTMIYPKNDHVISRDDILGQLDKLLPHDEKPHRAAIYGYGGCGKTQIALQYAYRRQEITSCSLFWVHAGTVARFTTDYNEIAKKALLPPDLRGDDMLKAVCDWLKGQVNWLMILDNADELSIFDNISPSQSVDDPSVNRHLYQYIPQTSGCLLWTSRDRSITRKFVSDYQGINVQKMSHDESLKLLRRLDRPDDSSSASTDEETLLGRHGLDQLPLAIVGARAFMRYTTTSIADYVQYLQKSEVQVLSEEFTDSYREMPHCVMKTWHISMTQIIRDLPRAEKVIKTIAFFENQGIPFELIREAANAKDNNYEQEMSDFDVRTIIGHLMDYSFLDAQQMIQEGDLPTYEQHRLLQLAVRNSLEPSETRIFSREAQGIMQTLFPIPKFENWNLCKRYLPHAVKVAHLEDPENDASFTNLWEGLGNYYSQQGLHKQAEQFKSLVFDRRNVTFGIENINTIRAMNNLAFTWRNQGYYSKAEPLQQQVLELHKAELGEKHPDTIVTMSNLASTWQSQGYYSKAEPLQQQVLELCKAELGEKHLDTITAMSYLASTWQSQGYYSKAEPLQQQVLKLRKVKLGEKHLDTTAAMSYLALTWKSQGYYSKAEPLQQQVLKLHKAELGEKHPDTILAMNNLASTWKSQGYFGKAEPLQQQVLKLCKAELGEKHLDTIRAMNNLASTWKSQGYYSKAEPLQQQVLELYKAKLGKKHPDTILAINNLASTWQSQGYYSKAEPLQQQVLKLRKAELGEKHLDTIRAMNNLALTWYEQREHLKAEEMQVEVLSLRRTALPNGHPDTLLAMENLEHSWKKLGRKEEAIALKLERESFVEHNN